MDSKTYHTMEYGEIESLVNKYFPMTNYNFVADEEANNYSSIKFDDITKGNYEKWTDYNKRDFIMSILGGGKNSTRLFLELFVHWGILPEGSYLVEVYW